LFQCAGKEHIAVGGLKKSIRLCFGTMCFFILLLLLGSAIWLDDELWSGRAEPGTTFNNPSLVRFFLKKIYGRLFIIVFVVFVSLAMIERLVNMHFNASHWSCIQLWTTTTTERRSD
jgi:hypothetical protein